MAHAKIQPKIAGAAQAMLDNMRAGQPDAFPERVVIPEPLAGDAIMLEGERIEILDPMPGCDGSGIRLGESIGAGTVVPGHRSPDAASDNSVFEATRAYLDQWETALAETNTADDLRAAMMAGNEDLGLIFAVDAAVAAAYPQ